MSRLFPVVICLVACTSTSPASLATVNEPEAPSSSPVVVPTVQAPAETPAVPDADPDADASAFPDALPQAPGRTDADRIACSFHWRRSNAHDFRPRDEATVLLRKPGDGRELSLGDTKVRVTLGDSSGGGHRLLIAVDAGTTRIDDDYDFGASTFPVNHPPGGLGFTGLTYVTHPKSGSELQYLCESGAEATYGPAAPSNATVSCEAEHIDLDGEQLFFDIDPRGTAAFDAKRGAMEIHAGYSPGQYDASAFVVDAGPGANVRSFVQGHNNLPVNAFVGAQGFTGTRTIEHTVTGETLAYSCWVQ